jgi:hypothetical protein
MGWFDSLSNIAGSAMKYAQNNPNNMAMLGNVAKTGLGAVMNRNQPGGGMSGMMQNAGQQASGMAGNMMNQGRQMAGNYMQQHGLDQDMNQARQGFQQFRQDPRGMMQNMGRQALNGVGNMANQYVAQHGLGGALSNIFGMGRQFMQDPRKAMGQLGQYGMNQAQNMGRNYLDSRGMTQDFNQAANMGRQFMQDPRGMMQQGMDYGRGKVNQAIESRYGQKPQQYQNSPQEEDYGNTMQELPFYGGEDGGYQDYSQGGHVIPRHGRGGQIDGMARHSMGNHGEEESEDHLHGMKPGQLEQLVAALSRSGGDRYPSQMHYGGRI